jgi:hypothetical protein
MKTTTTLLTLIFLAGATTAANAHDADPYNKVQRNAPITRILSMKRPLLCLDIECSARIKVATMPSCSDHFRVHSDVARFERRSRVGSLAQAERKRF